MFYVKKLVYFFSTTPTAGRLYPGWHFRLDVLYYAVCAAAGFGGVWALLRSPERARALPCALRLATLLCIVTIAVIQSAYYVEIRHRWASSRSCWSSPPSAPRACCGVGRTVCPEQIVHLDAEHLQQR